MLPKNRKEVFFDVVKNNWGRFLLYGCLVLLISLPLQVSAVLGDLYQMQLSSMLDAGQITSQEAVLLASSSDNTLALTGILCWVIFAIGLSGLAHIMRQHAWEESVYFRYEYIKGIRQNAGSFILLGLLTGLVRFACGWFHNVILLNGGNAYYYAGYLPAAWAAVLLLPPAAYLAVCIPIYSVKFYQNVKTAFMLYFKNLFKTVLAVALCGAVFLLQLIPGFYVQIVCRVAICFALPFILLAWFLFTYDRLDETVNPKWYPFLVGRGVYQGEK